MTTSRILLASVAIAALALVGGIGAESASAASTHYSNCTSLQKHYRHGVARSGAHDHVSGKSKPVTNFKVSTSLYNANKKLDRDKDGVACEKH